jgi:hypothetical protein
MILAHQIIIFFFGSPCHKGFVTSDGLPFEIFQAGILLDPFFFLSQNAQVQSLFPQGIKVYVVHVCLHSISG